MAESSRGLRSVGTASAHLVCRHCGVPLATPAAQESGFCCSGCAYVFRLVQEHGLGAYYRIKDAVTSPAEATVFQSRDYEWLQTAQAVAEKESAAPELVLEVQGISCAGCVWLIEKIFHQHPGALEIETNAPSGRLRLRWARGEFNAAAWAAKLQAFNYLVGPAGAATPELESRQLVRRIGLGAALAMNVMLFTLPTYFGMEASFPYARLFGTLSFVLATLSVLAGGGYFFRRAFSGLRDRVVHIDLPISVGIAGAYLGSAWGWLTEQERFVYFDFVSAFIVLMLVGRWAQTAAVERNRRRLLSRQPRPEWVRWLGEADVMEKRPVETLRTGDRYELHMGEIVPVTSRLLSESARIGTAWISGEAEPRECRRGALMPAGALHVGHTPLRLRATEAWADSLLSRLLRDPARDAYRHRFLERVISGYLVAIFVAATAAGVGWWLASHDAARTWSVVTAVLVVSCPCAIGLAFPLTDELATAALRRAGVFVREADVWPRLKAVRKIVFDKTGTLTLETPTLRNTEALQALDAEARAALFTLTRDNPHPVSQALTEELLGRSLVPSGTSVSGEIAEIVGQGLTLSTGTHRWALGRPRGRQEAEKATGGLVDGTSGSHDTEFTCDGVGVARFRFEDAARQDAASELVELRKHAFDLFILSGDRREKVHALARALRFPLGRCIAEVSPEEKAAWIRAKDRRDTLMLGDGANDSLAFDAAFVRGTPVVYRGVLEGKSDFYYLGRDLAGIRRLFEVDALRRRTHRWLLTFSIVYNLLAVGLAMLGHMSPLLAAVLMPVSSLLTLAIVGVGMRRAV